MRRGLPLQAPGKPQSMEEQCSEEGRVRPETESMELGWKSFYREIRILSAFPSLLSSTVSPTLPLDATDYSLGKQQLEIKMTFNLASSLYPAKLSSQPEARIKTFSDMQRLRTHAVLRKCLSNSPQHRNHLRILVNCRFWFRGPESPHS